MIKLWDQESGFTYTNIPERVFASIQLPLSDDSHALNATVSKHAGQIPSGLLVFEQSVAGTPYEVKFSQTSTAIFRAQVEIVVTEIKLVERQSKVLSVVTLNVPDNYSKLTGTGVVAAGGVLTKGKTYYLSLLEGKDYTLHLTQYSAEAGKDPIQLPVSSTTETVSKFEDIALSFVVEGANSPVWVTPSGALTVNPTGHIFVLYNTPVSFKLSVFDNDVSAGDQLQFYIPSEGGSLPPGLNLSKDGIISGIIGDAPSVGVTVGSGNFDADWYDRTFYDINVSENTNGVQLNTRTVRKFSRIYEFIVVCTDGLNTVERQFSIYCIPEEFLRADNSLIQVGHSAYTSDCTYLRAPYFLSERDLGNYRTQNNVTLFIDAYNPNPQLGDVKYSIDPLTVTCEATVVDYPFTVSAKNGSPIAGSKFYLELPSGRSNATYTVQSVVQEGNLWYVTPVEHIPDLVLDTRVVFGYVSPLTDLFSIDSLSGVMFGNFGNSSNRTYEFTVTVDKFDSAYTSYSTFALPVYALNDADIYVRSTATDIDLVPYISGEMLHLGPRRIPYVVKAATRISPTDVLLRVDRNVAVSDLSIGDLIETTLKVPSNWLYAVATNRKNFVVSVTDEETTDLAWTTPSNLGTLVPDVSSMLKVEATAPNGVPITYITGTTYDSNTTRFYEINDSNELLVMDNFVREGLELQSATGLIVGKLSKNSNNLFSFDNGATTFDFSTTTIDSVIRFNVYATAIIADTEQSIQQEFTISVGLADTTRFSEMWLKAYMPLNQRELFDLLVTNSEIFPTELLYRGSDPAFGVQKEVKMLLYAGIETASFDDYIAVMAKNFGRKRLLFGDLKVATAIDGTTPLYDVVYVEMVDTLENDLGQSLPVEVLVNNTTQYPNSIDNMRSRLIEAFVTKNALLPKWMLSPQADGSGMQYVKAVPICYCLPRAGETIIRNIKTYGFDFTNLTFEVDRIVIDGIVSTTGDILETRFIHFPSGDINE